jgi:hypothetical protein
MDRTPCSGRTWHSERLTEEFTAADAGRIASLEDYLALEDRLFAQLDERSMR